MNGKKRDEFLMLAYYNKGMLSSCFAKGNATPLSTPKSFITAMLSLLYLCHSWYR